MIPDFSMQLANDLLFQNTVPTAGISVLAPTAVDLTSIRDPMPGGPMTVRFRVTRAGTGAASNVQFAIVGRTAAAFEGFPSTLVPGDAPVLTTGTYITTDMTLGKIWFAQMSTDPSRTIFIPGSPGGVGEQPGYRYLQLLALWPAAVVTSIGVTVDIVHGHGDVNHIYPSSFNPRIGN